jgi:hypothetical protein
MKTSDEVIYDLVVRAAVQCGALSIKLSAVINQEDQSGNIENEVSRGISRNNNRAFMIFAEPGATNHGTLIFVDAILDLARLLNDEHQAGNAND